MSNNLSLTQLATNQASPEVPLNTAQGQVDAAITEMLDLDVTSGDFALTNAQYRGNVFFRAINATGGVRNVTIPVVKRGLMIFASDPGNTKLVNLVRGATTIAMQPGGVYVVRTDGSADGLWAYAINEDVDLHVFLPGVMTNGQLCLRRKVTRPFTLPITLVGSFASATANATASTTITLKKNGASIGTIVFALGASTATFTFVASVSFAVGDVLTIEGPVTADATLANVTLDLYGTR